MSPMQNQVFRYRLRFEKKGPSRFLSHKDLMRLMERAGRRAALDLAFTAGFNPHPVISIMPALKLGMEGFSEAAEIDLRSGMDGAEVAEAIGRTLPDGMRATSAALIKAGRRARVASCSYRVFLDAEAHGAALLAGRRGSADLPPCITSVSAGEGFVDFAIDCLKDPVLRLEAALEALFGPGAASGLRIARTRVSFEDEVPA